MFAKLLLSNSAPELTNILVIPAFSGYSFFKIFPNLNCPALLNADVDIYAPCALGATIDKKTIDQLKCKIIAGAANNQLAESKLGIKLKVSNTSFKISPLTPFAVHLAVIRPATFSKIKKQQ